MPLSDQARIALERRHPRIVDLWFALQPLKTVVGFMQSGAHPDDETSAMLAALAFRDGLSLSYACSTRGEGGQNDIGTEATEDLGTLRTAEMERAADVLSMRLYWHSTDPEDTIFDFGFSKSGAETLETWGVDRILDRFVEIVRIERPDILCVTFLDVPGQHGHHRAMTEAAHLVMGAAADPDYGGSLGAPWEIKKLYLPAWSGAGQAYDDDLPPPPATITIEGTGVDPITGWSYARIGQQSRAFHRTQGMGRWVVAGAEQDWPLHLAETRLNGPDDGLLSGLPASLADLADGAGAAANPLNAAARYCAEAVAAFPDFDAVLRAATVALTQVRAAHAACPPSKAANVLHRLDRKERELARVIQLAAGVEVVATLDRDWLRPGETAKLALETRRGAAETLGVTLDLPTGWSEEGANLTPGAAAAPSDPYRAAYDPLHPPAPALAVTIGAHGVGATQRVALTPPPVLLPARTATLTPDRAVLNTATDQRQIDVQLSDLVPASAVAALETPEGWHAQRDGATLRLTAPDALAPGPYTLPLTLDGTPALSLRRIVHDHIAPRARSLPAQLTVQAVEARLPPVRIGFIGGGNDRVGHWLGSLGADLQELSDTELADPQALDGFDSIVIGIFALKFRPSLRAAMPDLHAWVAAGGTLLTLYHRPWDNWDPDTVPPKRLEIGQPSLRWRVTDQNAPVRHLVPDHPLLNTPNPIGPDDWVGWQKERGLYFAKSWDPAYTPLLEMADPGEAPHQGALLTADIGAGRHTHTSLILHHQMEKLTPGAFRLMANLVARR